PVGPPTRRLRRGGGTLLSFLWCPLAIRGLLPSRRLLGRRGLPDALARRESVDGHIALGAGRLEQAPAREQAALRAAAAAAFDRPIPRDNLARRGYIVPPGAAPREIDGALEIADEHRPPEASREQARDTVRGRRVRG